MKKKMERKSATYYMEYDKDVLFEKIEGLINPFISYVKDRKNLDDDYFDPNTIQVIRRFTGK